MDITAESTIIIDSGGQYLEGTTAVTRTRKRLSDLFQKNIEF